MGTPLKNEEVDQALTSLKDWRRDGKDLYKTSLTASGDGKTLTESGSAAGVNEKFNVVYDKQ